MGKAMVWDIDLMLTNVLLTYSQARQKFAC